MKITDIQKVQLRAKEISEATLKSQLKRFKTGFPIVKLDRPATVDDGITRLTKEEHEAFIELYEQHKGQLELIKFVPASGAATRMFKFLHEFLNSFNPQEETINSYINNNKTPELFAFFIGLEKFPFYEDVVKALKEKNPDWASKPIQSKKIAFIKEMLLEDGFNYGAMPKGLVPFHKYKDHVSTAFEEHLFEASIYATTNQKARLHFTIAPAYENHFTDEFDRIEKIVEEKTNAQFDISFSYQSTATDTIAVDHKNKAVVLDNGEFLFRPAGHGALLENLNQLDADLLFIKNIDNVTVSSYEQQVCSYKKSLAGLLIDRKNHIHQHLRLLENDKISDLQKKEIESFLAKELGVVFPKDYYKFSKEFQLEYLFTKLNRPIRVCGMVKNEGEPGGGPFWISNAQGELSLQIVESAQINMDNAQQNKIAAQATHFNPVDLICSVRDHHGKKYDLKEFCDKESGFITYKSHEGKNIKAQELPGLWNGGMAFWNTLFVEVPLITFNPVKTVNDLLKSAHQLD